MRRQRESAAAMVACFGLMAVLALVVLLTQPRFLPCQEDEVIMGTGDFHGPQRGWDDYRCIPADDLSTL